MLKDLIIFFLKKLDLDELEAQGQIKREVARYRKFSYGILGQDINFERRPIDIDTRNYAKYILMEGSKDERRELLRCLKSRLELKDRIITLRISRDS